MPRRVQEPTEKSGLHGSWDKNSRAFEHPAFGQIVASRVSGGGAVLYGSDFVHNNYVSITIRRSQLGRELSRDWHFGKDELIQVHMSEAQWASFVSSMNVGSGVPCTLGFIRGEGEIPGIPYRNEKGAAEQEAKRVFKGMAARVERAIESMKGELGESISKKKRDALLNEIVGLKRELENSLPFMADMFAEHMEAVVEKAKIEVNAYVVNTVTRAGLDSLRGEDPVLRLGKGEDDEDSG